MFCCGNWRAQRQRWALGGGVRKHPNKKMLSLPSMAYSFSWKVEILIPICPTEETLFVERTFVRSLRSFCIEGPNDGRKSGSARSTAANSLTSLFLVLFLKSRAVLRLQPEVSAPSSAIFQNMMYYFTFKTTIYVPQWPRLVSLG